MPCCPTIQVPFFEAAVTTIPYTPLMQAQYGPTPRVYAYYFDAVTGELLQSSWFTLMKIDAGDNIVVDHGGTSTGFVLIR